MKIALLANPDHLHVQRWTDFLHRRGHQILIVADPHARAELPGVETHRAEWKFLSNLLAFRLTPAPHGNSLWKCLHYRPIIQRFGPDVVHGFEAYYNGLATAWAGPYPKVLTPWGKDVHFDAFQGRLWHWIVRRAVRGVDCLTTNDETMPAYLAEVFGVPPERTIAFSWGVDLGVFNPGQASGAAEWRTRLDISESAPVIFSPRKFNPYWGSEAIIEAVPAVLAEIPEAIFVFMATEDRAGFRSAMQARAGELGVAPSVRWIEQWIRPDQMADLYNLAQAFVSIPHTDLLAMSVLEGMACGCLPILADHPAYGRHVRHETGCGPNALLLPEISPPALAEAIIKGLGDAPLRESAAKFNADRMKTLEDASVNMAKIEDVYAAAIERFNAKQRKP